MRTGMQAGSGVSQKGAPDRVMRSHGTFQFIQRSRSAHIRPEAP
jgi:hypothetical protein